VQIPTTLLAQVDSSIGGKVGVNLKAGKNLVGAFHQPRHVFCDLDALNTLSSREFKAGLAEIVKYGIIHDARLFALLEKEIDSILAKDRSLLTRIIARSCAIKAEVVEQDEREGGLRAILNFGHTIGHAIEAVSGYGRYLHGEAISIGQVAASLVSRELTGLSEDQASRIRALFQKSGLPVMARWTDRDMVKLKQAMSLDKKARAGVVNFVLAERIGRATWGHSVSVDCLDKAMEAVREL
jgi:3-dehydroquinate synthase